MDPSFTVFERGTVYVDGGRITQVAPTGSLPPPGFQDAPVIGTRGTIYPGLIDLHNHLSYDALALWQVPQLYTNRDQWGRHPDYRKLISGPMTVLGKTPGYVEAVVRYVECKSMLGGVTTAQGIALFSNQGITHAITVAWCVTRRRPVRMTSLMPPRRSPTSNPRTPRSFSSACRTARACSCT
jgi:cytosine/adenosine deaminase-related metal-dependent hydrolase